MFENINNIFVVLAILKLAEQIWSFPCLYFFNNYEICNKAQKLLAV